MRRFFILLSASVYASAPLWSQNVGIGTLVPSRGKLEIQGTGIGNTVAIFGGDARGISIQRGNPSIGFNQYFDGTNSRYIGDGYAAVQWLNAATGNMYFDMFGAGSANGVVSSTTTAIIISKNGNVGIGTPPLPLARLTVARGTGPYGTALFRGTVYPSHINYNITEDTYIRGGKPGGIVYINDVSGSDILFGNPTATAASLVAVGINNPNPQFALEMRQSGTKGLVLVASSFHNWQLNVGPNTAQGSFQRLIFDEAANPIGSFHPQTGAYNAVSDERLKKDITPMPGIGQKLLQLQPVQYLVDNVQGGEEKQAGFIAQDLLQVFPGLVTHQKETVPGATIPDMHLVNYDGLAVYAIRLIQEQQQTILDLKNRLGRLKQLKEKDPRP